MTVDTGVPAPTISPNFVPSSVGRRISAPDLARGIMLLGIALANVSAFLWGRPMFSAIPHLTGGSALDSGLSAVIIVLVDQRVYPMFAFLFGYGIIQFAQSRAARGVPEQQIRRMLRRRHLWLIAFGAVHAALLFVGDVLGAYGLSGLILVAIFWRASDKAIKVTVWILVGLAALGAALVAGLGAVVAAFVPADMLLFEAEMTTVGDLLSGQTNYLIAALIRLGIWVIATPTTVLGLLVPAAMMLGMLGARHRWLEGVTQRARLRSVASWAIAIGVLGALPVALAYLDLWPALTKMAWSLTGVTQVTGLVGGIGYAALFGAIGSRLSGDLRGGLGAIAALGKRSLSFYLVQSLIYAPLLSAWGFGLGATIGSATAYAIAVLVWLLSVAAAAVLERRARRGPAEMLLRRLTYGLDPEPRT